VWQGFTLRARHDKPRSPCTNSYVCISAYNIHSHKPRNFTTYRRRKVATLHSSQRKLTYPLSSTKTHTPIIPGTNHNSNSRKYIDSQYDPKWSETAPETMGSMTSLSTPQILLSCLSLSEWHLFLLYLPLARARIKRGQRITRGITSLVNMNKLGQDGPLTNGKAWLYRLTYFPIYR